MSNPNQHKFSAAYNDAAQYVFLKCDGALNYTNFKKIVQERIKNLHPNDSNYKLWMQVSNFENDFEKPKFVNWLHRAKNKFKDTLNSDEIDMNGSENTPDYDDDDDEAEEDIDDDDDVEVESGVEKKIDIEKFYEFDYKWNDPIRYWYTKVFCILGDSQRVINANNIKLIRLADDRYELHLPMMYQWYQHYLSTLSKYVSNETPEDLVRNTVQEKIRQLFGDNKAALEQVKTVHIIKLPFAANPDPKITPSHVSGLGCTIINVSFNKNRETFTTSAIKSDECVYEEDDSAFLQYRSPDRPGTNRPQGGSASRHTNQFSTPPASRGNHYHGSRGHDRHGSFSDMSYETNQEASHRIHPTRNMARDIDLEALEAAFRAKLEMENHRWREDTERKLNDEFVFRDTQRTEFLTGKLSEIDAYKLEKDAMYQRMAEAGQRHFSENMRFSRELSEMKQQGYGKVKPGDRTVESDSFLVSRSRASRNVVDVHDMMLKGAIKTGLRNVSRDEDQEFHDSCASAEEVEEVYTDFLASTNTPHPVNEVCVEMPLLKSRLTGLEHTISKTKRTRNRVPTNHRYNIIRSFEDKDIADSKYVREHAHSDRSEAAATNTTINGTTFNLEDGSFVSL